MPTPAPLNTEDRQARPIPRSPSFAVGRFGALLRGWMLIALDRMLRLYGLRRTGSVIEKGSHWSERRDNRFAQGAHNDLRITRILKSLRLLGSDDVVRQFADALRTLAATERDAGVSAVTLRFRSDAVA